MMAATGAAPKFALAALMLLSGCIPPAGNDYRIRSRADAPAGSSAETVPESRQAQGAPIILVPEAELLEVTPSWNPATVQRNAQAVAGSTYTVQAGDTLYRIGNVAGTGADAIARANALVSPYILQLGQKLAIPAGLYHRVAAGETGIAIARAYNATWSDLVGLNGLTEPYALRAGQFLQLPDSALVTDAQRGGSQAQSLADAFVLDIDAIATGSQPARPETGRPATALTTPVATPTGFSGVFGWPLTGTIASRFGSKGGGQVNDGINIAAPLGSNVLSAGDGVVVYSGNEISVFGGLVMIDHGGGWITAYGHMGGLAVSRGAKVKRGQTLGSVGDTGYVSTPQLHFEIRKDRKPLDPLTKLPAR